MGKSKAKKAATARRHGDSGRRSSAAVANTRTLPALFGKGVKPAGGGGGLDREVYIAASSGCGAAENLLTRQELAWACEARDAAAELHVQCTTVELVQVATVSKGDPEKTRSRLVKLQALKDEYALEMSFSAAHTMVKEPSGGQFLVPCGRLQASGSVGFAANYAGWTPGNLTPEMVPMALGLICGMFEALSCSLFDIRNGVFVVANAKGMGSKNVSLSMEAKFARLYNKGYPVRVAQLVVVDANFLARTVIKVVKALLSKKLSDRLISIQTAELPEHFKIKELPPFLGDGSNREDSISYHARHAAKRRQLDAALCKSYGYKFESTPSDMALWIEVGDAPATPRPPL